MLQLLRIGLMTKQLPKSAAVLALLLGALEVGIAGLFPFAPAPAAVPAPALAAQPEVPSPTPSPTHTALPTATALPTLTPAPPSATPTPDGWDAWEPNDTLDGAAPVAVNQTLTGLTLAPAGDVDAFKVYGKAGQILNLTTFVQAGSDTRLQLYSPGGTLLAENDDKSATDLGSALLWPARSDGWLFVAVTSAIPGYGGRYDLALLLESPTPVPSATATEWPAPTLPPATTAPTATGTPPAVADDAYEPNNAAQAATEIIIGTAYQASLPTGDVDYYRLLGKAGNRYRCETQPTGVDTALSVYSQNMALLAENDDRAAGDVGSAADWIATETGNVTIAVQNRAGRGAYTVSCSVVLPETRPPAGGSGTSAVPTATPTVAPTAEPALTVRFLGQSQPTATPVVETVVRLVVVYDKNNNRAADIGEGIKNVSARALYGGRVVAWGLTDERGEVTLRVVGDVERITIPYFNFWEMRVRPGETPAPRTVIVPPVQVPVILPVETPPAEGS